jgi:hypothetical protein
MNNDFEKYRKQAENGTLPAYFNQWDLANKDGWSVAHSAAYCGNLPSHFTQWELMSWNNGNSVSVAHVAARWGHLPANFDWWELADNDGWTVAHTAAMGKKLPCHFDQWSLRCDDTTKKSGTSSVLEVVVDYDDSDLILALASSKPRCRREEDWEEFKVCLPEIYIKYNTEEVLASAEDTNIPDATSAHLL